MLVLYIDLGIGKKHKVDQLLLHILHCTFTGDAVAVTAAMSAVSGETVV